MVAAHGAKLAGKRERRADFRDVVGSKQSTFERHSVPGVFVMELTYPHACWQYQSAGREGVAESQVTAGLSENHL